MKEKKEPPASSRPKPAFDLKALLLPQLKNKGLEGQKEKEPPAPIPVKEAPKKKHQCSHGHKKKVDAKTKEGGKGGGQVGLAAGFGFNKGGGNKKSKGKNTGDLDDEDLDQLSFKKLQQMIVENHPVDPDTKERFSLTERVTVRNYTKKLFDVCCLLRLFKLQRELMRKIKDLLLTTICKCCKKEKYKWPKPKSMEKIPDSDSDSGDDAETNIKNELTQCGRNLGEGAVLYLQMMKTFAILFAILSIINLPLYYSYYDSSSNNNQSFNQVWKYLNMGNIGNTDNVCGWSSIDLVVLDHESEQLNFECAEGQYISELKYFGFLQAIDLRFNIESFGESWCKSAEYPNAAALYLGSTPLGSPPLPECGEDEDPDVDECLSASDLAPGGGRRLVESMEQKGQEIPHILKDIVQVIEMQDELDFSLEKSQPNQVSSPRRYLRQEAPPEREECLNCFRSQQRYCQDKKFNTENGYGHCCNPALANCTSEEFPRFCHSEESFVNSTLFSADDIFYRSVCPEIEMCHRWTKKRIELLQEQEMKFDLIEELYDLENDVPNLCSYWIKPPMLAEDNDQINIKITNMGNHNVTIMMVTEDKYGEIEYIPDMAFSPTINNHYYSFQLHKLQNDINEQEKPDRYRPDPEQPSYRIRRPDEEFAADMEAYNEHKSYALKEGYQTQFSLLLTIEGTQQLKEELMQEDYQQGQLVQVSIKETPGTKFYTDNELETAEQRDERYTFEYYPVYDTIKDIGQEADATQLPDDYVQESTDFNVDPKCKFNNEWDEETSIFRSEMYNDFFKQMIVHNCFNKSSCEINPSFYTQHEDEFDTENYDQGLNILNKLSNNCLQRIRYQNITSSQFIMILGCQNDYITSPMGKFHKENFGILLVATDIMCILIITYFFGKIKELNAEFIGIVDDLQITMSDYALQLQNMRVDRFSQDPRILHMKLWMYLNQVLKPKRYPGNKMDVIDINLSMFNSLHVKSIMKLQKIQEAINSVKNNILAGMFDDPESEDQQKRVISRLEDKFDREKIIYLELTDKNVDRSRQLIKKLPRSMKIKDVVYVYVIFKHCSTVDECLAEFKYDIPLKDFVKQVFGIGVTDIRRKQFQYNNLIMDRSLEPDEIIWQNLVYNYQNQRNRTYVAKIVSLMFILGIIIYEMYTETFSDLIDNLIKSADCPEFYKSYDLTTKYSKSIALEDYLKPAEQQLGLMECYCSLQTSLIQPWTLFIDVFVLEGVEHRVCLKMHFLWFCKKVMGMLIDIGVVFINGLIAILIDALENFTKHHSRRSQQISAFRQIFVLEFLNMGAIQLLSSQTIFKSVNEGILSPFGQEPSTVYSGFTPKWYMNTGLIICLFLFTNSFVSNLNNWNDYLKVEFKRLKDRTLQTKLKKDPDDPDDDEPNTRCLLQSEVEQLYTGATFEGESAYSRMMSTLFSLLLFSSGMPILYVIGFVFFFGTYITNKVMILRFYTRSGTLTRTIPNFAQQALMASVYLHIILGGFMFTNQEVFLTKERAEDRVEFDVRSELEKEIIAKNEDDSGYQFFKTRLLLFHQQMYSSFVVGYLIMIVAGQTLKNVLSLCFQLIKFVLVNIFETAKKCLVGTFNCLKNLVKGDESEETEEVVESDVILTSRLSTEQDTIKDYKDTDEETNTQRTDQLLTLLKSALLQKVLDEKDRIQSERSKKKQMRMERKTAIIEAREAVFWRNMEQKKKRADYSENICNEVNVNYLQKFYQRSKKELVDYMDIFNLNASNMIDQDLMDPNNTSKKSQLFLEVCYVTRITSIEAINFQKILVKRIRTIEHKIDQHFKLITDILLKKKQAEFEKQLEKRRRSGKLMSLQQQHAMIDESNKAIDDMKKEFVDIRTISSERKCTDLIKNQEELVAADKARKENRQGIQEICRMQGSKSQSFFLFDQPQNAIGRKIYFAIEEEEPLEFSEGEEKRDQAEGEAGFESSPDESGSSPPHDKSLVKTTEGKSTAEGKPKEVKF